MKKSLRERGWKRRRIRALRRLGYTWVRKLELTLAKRFGVSTREERRFFFLIPVVGVVVGLLGVSVHRLIDFFRRLLWGDHESLLEAATSSSPLWIVAAPMIGGILVGGILIFGKRRVSGYGMGVLVESVVLRRGRVPKKPISLSALAAIVTVGSGGSLGKEGPMIRLGAMLSSSLGEKLELTDHQLKILVGCGAAAGLAVAYNIPIGGALFAMEVILGNFALDTFGPVVAASLISTLIARGFEGNVPAFPVPLFAMDGGWEILAFFGLGIVGAISSVIFTFSVRSGSRMFHRQKWIPAPVRPMIGLALVGVLALKFPHILGSGAETVSLTLEDKIPWQIIFLLPLAKILATSLTAGGGGAGGLFTPTLFIGATVGSSYGLVMAYLFPDWVISSPAAYAVVGMAAVSAGASHAPISAILILFEFTGNYEFILPLMAAGMTASLLSRSIFPHSTYTYSLARKGVDLSWRMEEAVLAGLSVKDLMRQDKETLLLRDSYSTVVERFFDCHRHRLFVVDAAGHLKGAITLHDIKHVLEDADSFTAILAADLVVPIEEVVYAENRLHLVAEKLAHSEFESLPVVDEETKKYLGLLTKRDLLAVYAQEVVGRPATLATFVSKAGEKASRDFVELPPDFTLRLLEIPKRYVGKTLAEARLTQDFGLRIIEIKREGKEGLERLIPTAETVLRREDGLIVLGPVDSVEKLAKG